MSNIPRLKTRAERRNINIVVDKKIDDIYRKAKANGYNASEIARQAVSEAFLRIAQEIERPAS
jgi:post-segregation antitoxin (ccd killing protein)